MKHRLPADSNGMAPPPKRQRTMAEDSALTKLAENQEVLSKLDQECEKQQMEVQRKYDAQKKPYFTERQKIIDEIPGFWGRAISNYPPIGIYLIDEDKNILKYLTKIDLDDNTDRFGSYKLTFEFSEAAKEYFTPLVWTKTVTFSESEAPPKEEGTEIIWAEGKKPQCKADKKDVEDEDEDDDEGGEESIAEWFCKDSSECVHVELGEIIRRAVYHRPQEFFDDADDDDDEDEECGDGDDDKEGVAEEK